MTGLAAAPASNPPSAPGKAPSKVAATSAASTNRLAEPTALLSLRPLDLLSAFPQVPRFEPIAFPAASPAGRIQQLALTEGR